MMTLSIKHFDLLCKTIGNQICRMKSIDSFSLISTPSGVVIRASTQGAVCQGSIPGLVKQNTFKMVVIMYNRTNIRIDRYRYYWYYLPV